MTRGIALVPEVEVDDEPTVVAPLPEEWTDVAEPDDPTVMASGVIDTDVDPPRGRADEIGRLFAEPPRLDRPAPEGGPDAGRTPNRRRRKLLLLFLLMAGTWLVIRPQPGARGPLSRLRSATPAAVPSPPSPVLRIPAAATAAPGTAVEHLAAGRYDAALAQYRVLADADPDGAGGVYPVIVDILTREVIAQCREQASPICEWR